MTLTHSSTTTLETYSPTRFGLGLRQCLLRLLLAAGMLVAAGGFAYADRISDSSKLVDSLVADIQNIVSQDRSREEIHQFTNKIIDDYFDYGLMARFTTGQYWRAASDSQRQAYLTAYREILLEQAVRNFNYFRTIDYVPQGAEAKGEKWVIVSGLIKSLTGENPDVVINWRVRTHADRPPTIFDLEIENVSMLITQRDENTAVIRQNGGDFDALIEILEKRGEELRQGT